VAVLEARLCCHLRTQSSVKKNSKPSLSAKILINLLKTLISLLGDGKSSEGNSQHENSCCEKPVHDQPGQYEAILVTIPVSKNSRLNIERLQKF
jgi:hypothetical protein